MKSIIKALFLTLATCCAATTLTGCLYLKFGGGDTSRDQAPTVGQQLVDLKKAKDSGAITEAEYEAQKARLIEHK